MKCSLTKKIPVALHNGSSYDCHLLIKESAEEFKNQFTYFGEKTEKYITFTVPIVIRIDKNGEKITKNISYVLHFIDSTKFMESSLSNIVNNRSEGIHRIHKCKYGHNDKKCKTCRIKYCD